MDGVRAASSKWLVTCSSVVRVFVTNLFLSFSLVHEVGTVYLF